MKSILFILTLSVLALPAAAQYEADVASEDAIIEALYEVISGPAGQQRDWDRFKHLFVEEGRLIPLRLTQEGTAEPMIWSPDAYAERVNDYFLENGFFEIEIARRSETFGHVTHAFSTYESRQTEADEQPFARGINSIQLLNDGERWWILNITWDAERAGNPIPKKYLK